MNVLERSKQIEVIAALCDGLGIRATARITGVNRETVGTLALRVGRGCAELHDRMMNGLHVSRLELDELWAYVGRRRRQHERPIPGDPRETYSVTHLAVKEASRRYSPAALIAVERDVVSGIPAEISTSYVERSHLTLRMSSKRFARLSNSFSKRIENHCAAVSLHVAFYNLCRTHEALRTTPAGALGIADRVWTIGELINAALATQPITHVSTALDRRRRFKVIEGGRD
jgi:hypothetical protein